MGHSSHNHGHHHGHHGHVHADPSNTPTGRLILSIILNLIITVAEVIGGIISGSLALLSDALHNLSDTTALAVSLYAAKLGERKADSAKTFGYQRAEIIGAFANLIVLIVIAIWLVVESVRRFLNPEPVDAPVMLIVAVIGLVANIVTALLLARSAKTSLNIRSAYLHIVTDALSSVGVIVGGLLIWKFGWIIVDPIMCALISAYILYHSMTMLRETIDILMDSSPANFLFDDLIRDVLTVENVIDIHHIHVWRRTENLNALEAHIVVDQNHITEIDQIKNAIKSVLSSKHKIGHATLEFELIPCDEAGGDDCFQTEGADLG